MEKQKYWRLLFVLLALAAIPIDPASAGPGGGTYYANSPAGGASGTALRKFVDSLPGLGPANKNNLGSYIPIATPITGAAKVAAGVPNDGDYYEIGLVEYSQKMHSDLPKKTKLRGYVDLNPVFLNSSSAQSRAQYLGPLIVAKRNVPVRVKFTNMLSTGTGGNLFIPVDTTLMGAGMGPYTSGGGGCDPMAPGANCAMYTQNRATLHLHGGNSPWISDGTPNQWTAPVGETSVPLQMRKGVSARDVPDMPAAGDGQLTFFWTNQQSNRLMFYHDHAYGITRLNVYAGEAAGYLLTDPVEEGLIDNGTLPNICPGGATATCEYRYGVPLIIQDRTFVPKDIDTQDVLWTKNSKGDANNWGSYGDLWFPHVYEPNQDPTSPGGANPFGRWDYGPWFWPPVPVAADKSTLPEPSAVPEGFMDTPIVNGTAYPYLTVEPRPYRFRILNASNDRGLNLSIFYSDPNDPSGKEVKMVPAGPNPSFPSGPYPGTAMWPTDGRVGGVPDPATMGPKIIQIGSESGFLPFPAVLPNQPVNYNYNRRDIVVLNVQEKNLFLAPAERADVVIDFSAVPPGSTLILYNDAPAPTPAFDPRYDYYTGNPDQTTSGGAPSTLRGYGPNTRTIMQFRVTGTPGASFDLAKLEAALPAAFKSSQPAPLVPEPTLPVASGGNSPAELYGKIQDYQFTFKPLNADYTQETVPVTIPFQSKAIQELWDPYGRMNATLGMELPFTTNLNQTTIPMGYAEPATERIVDGQPQVWKITHNGVDTHPVHFHMLDVQLVNRVGWDGAIRPPDENERGWKETVRMNPLEDVIVALRPKAQTLPAAFGVLPKSIRPIDPTLPANARLKATDFGNLGATYGTVPLGQGTPAAAVAVTIDNTPGGNSAGYDFGYEYVWHCHILGHEENDFMRPVIFTVSTTVPDAPLNLAASKVSQAVAGKANYIAAYMNAMVNQVVLQWDDGPLNDHPSNFRIERAVGAGAFQPIAKASYVPGYPPIFTDASLAPATTYSYRIVAYNAIGDSVPSNTVTVTTDSWSGSASVALTASKPAPHVVGTDVQFTATAAGATSTSIPTPNPNGVAVAYQYRFWLTNVVNGTPDPATKTLVQDYGNGNAWTMPDTTRIGRYMVTADVRTSSAVDLERSTSMSYDIIDTPIPPVTVASPVPGVYSAAPVTVTLTATTNTVPPPNTPATTIFYTLDGTIPTTASPIYSAPIVLNATTTINYFAIDSNSVAEAIHTDTWAIHVPDMIASVKINNGATSANSLSATLALNAFDPVGVATMQFSNDGNSWSAEEPYSTSKVWTLAAGVDGPRTVYVRFRDKSLPQPGVQYPPITAGILLDTLPPVTTPSPVPGTYANGPISVTLTCNDGTGAGCDKIYYTVDGSTPTAGSSVYATPIAVNNVSGQSTTIKYMAVDAAGNAETPQTGQWTMHISDMAASIRINDGASWTTNASVTLAVSASDPEGVATMEFSNDGTTWSNPEPFGTGKTWTLSGGEGLKSVYARFRDASQGGGHLYEPVTTSILYGTKDGLLPGTGSYVGSAVKALQIANGLVAPTPLDLVHADVAPYSNGVSSPDGKINLLDVYTIMLRMVGLIAF